MTNNTYQALCDSVGAYEEYGCGTYAKCQYKDDRPDVYCQNCNKDNLQRINYPPATAEQRERLEELILTACEKYFDFIGDWEIELSSLSKWRFKDGTYEYEIEKITNYNESQADSEIFVNIRSKSASDALYALTHKLVTKGVLGKEEVAKALKGGE